MKKAILSILILSSCLFSSLVPAHHGGALEWNRDGEPMGPVSGVVTRFAFVFPHVQVYFDRTDESGNTMEMAVSTRWTPTVLRSYGWSRNMIKPGDEISVTYAPHVSRNNVGSIVRMEINGEHIETNFDR